METIKNIILTTLTYLLAVAVVLSCLHVKDLAAYKVSAAQLGTASVTDVVAKALSDLHTHVDKTALKNIVKSIGDQTAMAYDRQLQILRDRNGRSVATVFMEALLLFRIAVATIR